MFNILLTPITTSWFYFKPLEDASTSPWCQNRATTRFGRLPHHSEGERVSWTNATEAVLVLRVYRDSGDPHLWVAPVPSWAAEARLRRCRWESPESHLRSSSEPSCSEAEGMPKSQMYHLAFVNPFRTKPQLFYISSSSQSSVSNTCLMRAQRAA